LQLARLSYTASGYVAASSRAVAQAPIDTRAAPTPPRHARCVYPGAVRTVGRLVLRIGVCLAVALGGTSPVRAAPAVALPHYDLNVALDLDAASLSAREVLTFTNTYGQALDSLVFKTPAGAVGSLGLTIATVDGQPVVSRFDASGAVLELTPAAGLAAGAAASVELDWSLQIPRQRGRLSAVDDVIALGNWLPTLAVHHGDWDRRPYTDIGDPFFSEVADYDLQLDLSRPATVAFTGDLVRQDGASWQIAARSVRDMAVSVSPGYQRLDAQINGGPLVSVYALDATRAQAELDAARTYAAAYAALVGPYPLATLRVAETGLQPDFAGMEYPGLVFVTTGLGPRASADLLHGIVAHEIAHQWFYGLLGDDELADPWLDEAFATYIAVEASETEPPSLSGASGNSLSTPSSGPAIDQGVFDFRDNSSYATAVYARGARFLAELRRSMGEAAWASFLHSLYATYADKVESPRAVLDLAQQAAPTVDLGALIAEYTRYSPMPAGGWSVSAPAGAWSGQVSIDVETSFPVSAVELWLDDRQIASGQAAGVFAVDATPVPAGDYVFLVRATDAQGAIYERATRVTVGE
jgi:hypothetical protein